MQPGGGHSFDFGYVKLTQAIHGSALPVNGLPYTFGLASGIILHAEGKTIYHAGDTALFSDMKHSRKIIRLMYVSADRGQLHNGAERRRQSSYVFETPNCRFQSTATLFR